ncbi:hypothetical protein P692DRAFT_20882046 [Suillus brevipes Sb2]|nr:hypothetical protein P692DRAFT_20882046 [Suillus brevipes Sb2]
MSVLVSTKCNHFTEDLLARLRSYAHLLRSTRKAAMWSGVGGHKTVDGQANPRLTRTFLLNVVSVEDFSFRSPSQRMLTIGLTESFSSRSGVNTWSESSLILLATFQVDEDVSGGRLANCLQPLFQRSAPVPNLSNASCYTFFPFCCSPHVPVLIFYFPIDPFFLFFLFAVLPVFPIGKLEKMLDCLFADSRGRTRMMEWFRPRIISSVSAVISQEMDAVKEVLRDNP